MRDSQTQRLARELGLSEQEVLEPFQALQSMRVRSIVEGLDGLSDEERRYALWLMERKDHERELQRKYFPYASRWQRARQVQFGLLFITSLVRYRLGLPDRPISEPEPDPNRVWNEKYHAWDNEYYQALEETGQLKEELFGHLTIGQRNNVEFLLDQYETEVMIIYTPHIIRKRRIPKKWRNYPERMKALLKLWLSESTNEPESS